MLQVIKKCPIRTKNSISHLKVPYRRLTPSAPFPLTTVFAFLQDYGRRNKVNCSDIFADYLLFPANYLTADTTRHLSSIKSCSKIDFMYSFLTLSDLYRQTARLFFLQIIGVLAISWFPPLTTTTPVSTHTLRIGFSLVI